ncbi:PDC [Branchiostoma lanceolatum]|uniref:PDC protein n=1 Tax=Branchiostoma lanceolatum TaxID=7740 RepID=A0A8K0A0E6_BRALA|nr:PDC [Branchiostoma lanceolatum]
MTTLDDKLLGLKTQYYASSSEDEPSDDEGACSDKDMDQTGQAPIPGTAPEYCQDPNTWQGQATNTGPKGVLEDWRRFKQLETERRAEQQAEKVALVKKLAFTCRSELNDAEKTEGQEDEDVELDEDFLRWYREQRLREMQQKASSLPTFGNVLDLTRSQYVDAIDKENKYVLIIIHIFERFVPGCDAVNGCFQCLAQDHPRVKFCRIQSSEADVSQTFTSKGLPAILAYRGGQLVANFLRITDQLGDDFFAGDLESFLVEHGLLQSKADVPTALKQSHSQDDDSDFDVD